MGHKFVNLALFLFAPVASSFASSPSERLFQYLDPKLSSSTRVEDLITRIQSRSALDQISQLKSNSTVLPGLPRVENYPYWNEGLHGVAGNGPSTVFPQAIGMAAMWDPELLHRVASAISDEGRAKYNVSTRALSAGSEEYPIIGLNFFSPNINIFRDPRWGRGQETYGEDPYLTSRMGVSFIRGIQGATFEGVEPKVIKMVATAKHFAVHSGPEKLRNFFDAQVDEHDLRDTYLPAFKAAVQEGKVRAVMCAYNRINGVPACASKYLLEDILRGEWHFKDWNGYVVSDCQAVQDVWDKHGYATSLEDASAKTLIAGTDVDCGHEYLSLVPWMQKDSRPGLREAVQKSLRRVFTARMAAGGFDPASEDPYRHLGTADIDSDRHRALALQAARESLVLLKNKGNALPLDKNEIKHLAVIGPNANELKVLLGNYSGMSRHWTTPLQGLRAHLGGLTQVEYAKGAELSGVYFDPIPASALRGLHANYYADLKFKRLLRASEEESVDFEFNRPEIFSVRWSGQLVPDKTGDYQIGVTADTGIRLWMGGHRIIDSVGEGPIGNHSAHRLAKSIHLSAGKTYPIQLEYFKDKPQGIVRLEWSYLPEANKRAETARSEAVKLAASADAAILFLGLSSEIENEEIDRQDIHLSTNQQLLLHEVQAAAKKTVLVLINGGPVTSVWAQEHTPAILEAWYPGEEGGRAIAEVLFGDYNPGGKLPVSIYRDVSDLRFEDYSMKNRTYRYRQQASLYPFGFGLSYTQFEYSGLEISLTKTAQCSGAIAQVQVRNSGKRWAGDEVVQLYVQKPKVEGRAEIRSLQGFKRVHLLPGESQKVQFCVSEEQLKAVTSQGKRVLLPGAYGFEIGGEQKVVSTF